MQKSPIEKDVEKVYNEFGGTQNEVSKKINIQNNKWTDENINKTYSEDKNGMRDLDNSFLGKQSISEDKLLNVQVLIEEIKSFSVDIN